MDTPDVSFRLTSTVRGILRDAWSAAVSTIMCMTALHCLTAVNHRYHAVKSDQDAVFAGTKIKDFKSFPLYALARLAGYAQAREVRTMCSSQRFRAIFRVLSIQACSLLPIILDVIIPRAFSKFKIRG